MLGGLDLHSIAQQVYRALSSFGATLGTLTVSGDAILAGKTVMSGDITPAQVTADQNNYGPTGLSSASVLRVSTDASRNFTGLAGGEDGRIINWTNVGSFAEVLKNENAGSIAANRFAFAGVDVVLTPGQAMLLQYDSTSSRWRAFSSPVDAPLPRMHISGLSYANNAGDTTNDLDIALGEARDASDAVNMRLAATITKQSDVVWAVGSAAGGLDTGVVGNSDYYVWLIKRSDTGVVDVLYSLSSTAPTMPANYTHKRLIGWFKRAGGTIVAFHTYETEGGGLEMTWDSPTLDINLAATLTTARRTDAVKVPLNFSVIANLNANVQDVNSTAAWIYCPDQADLAPSVAAAPGATLVNVAGNAVSSLIKVRTSAAGLIAARSTEATCDSYRVATLGFNWARRN